MSPETLRRAIADLGMSQVGLLRSRGQRKFYHLAPVADKIAPDIKPDTRVNRCSRRGAKR